jgi:hypothetical protein
MTEHHEQPPQVYESDLMFRSRKQRKKDEKREQIRRDLAEQDARDAAASAGAIFSSHDAPQYVTTTASAWDTHGDRQTLPIRLDDETIAALARVIRMHTDTIVMQLRRDEPAPRTVPAAAFYVVLLVACAWAAAFVIAVLL